MHDPTFMDYLHLTDFLSSFQKMEQVLAQGFQVSWTQWRVQYKILDKNNVKNHNSWWWSLLITLKREW